MTKGTYVPKADEKSIVEFKSSSTTDKNVVWIVEGGLGKNIAATALCQTVKESYPDRRLIMVVSYPEVFLNNPFVDRVYFSGNRPYFYEDFIKDKDTLIFKHEPYHQTGHILRKKHLIENWCDLLSIPYTGQTPQIHVNMAQKMTHSLWMRDKPTMVLQTNGGPLTGQKYGYSWCRDIPFDIAQAIANKYKDEYHIFQVTRPESQKLQGVEVVDNAMTNMELFAMLVGAQKRILIDSSLQHAAASFNLPSTVLWVGTSPTVFGYKLHNNIVAKEPKGGTKMIDAYIFDYNLDGVLHECPYIDVNEMFDINQLVRTV
jgi:hypothetical protein